MKGSTQGTSGRVRSAYARRGKPLVGRAKAGADAHAVQDEGSNRTDGRAAHRTRVLVAEDAPRARAGLVDTLVKLGMRVRRVGNPYDVLAEVEAFRPEVVFLDDHFQGSGAAYRTIIPELRSRFPRTRVVVTYDGSTGRGGAGRDRATAPLTWGAVSSIERGKTVDGESVRRYVEEAVGA